MTLKAILENLDGLNAALHEFYVERNGKFELQVEGMKTFADVERVQSALTKERDEHKNTKAILGKLGDHKIDDVVAALDRLPELEAAAAGKLDDEKINQIVESRIKSKLAPVERERDTLRAELGESKGLIDEFKGKDRTRAIHDAVRKAGLSAKVLPEAMEDALLLGERIFDVDESGTVVTKDNVGVTPGIEPKAWFTDIARARPHWWGQSIGGGAGGNRGGSGFEKNPFSAEHWNMTEQGQLLLKDRSAAEQMARTAGTTIGGPRPVVKK